MASDAARLLLLLAVAAALAGRSEGGWCVCRPDLPDAALQKTLDYACGGGADCKPILQNGACFSPDTVKAHCSYAVNSFYQRSGQNPQACAFSGTAFLSNNDPGSPGCPYPSTPRLCKSPPVFIQTYSNIYLLKISPLVWTARQPRKVQAPSMTLAAPASSQ
ncbi:hypothetical protein BRADI_1g08230v3 [Brachypodium distachyon]|uniref:X8 domain-containing protein n=1 Tax=Brachypodium distachyon TaxID=15368 RepID=A0A0Q3N8U4_BRADI|nr:hypothetical protein BRADI_1g08230v3 [Brachypodium distachyon]